MNTENCSPGFLFEPLGWAAQWVIAAVANNQSLLPCVLSITPRRMHLIALVLSHCEPAPVSEAAQQIIAGPAATVLQLSLGWHPSGLKGALGGLEQRVLEKESYRALIALLKDPDMAKLLSHGESITEDSLMVLRDLPPGLRHLAFDLGSSLTRQFAEGLRLLAARGSFPSYQALIAELEDFADHKQLVARLRDIVEGLPLWPGLPPDVVGNARRIDSPSEIHRIARRWRNCLRNYLWDIELATYAVYLWEDEAVRAAIGLRRHGRLGWFIEDVRGPRNRSLMESDCRAIGDTFATHGIPSSQVAWTIQEVVSRNRRPPVRHAEPDEDWLEAA